MFITYTFFGCLHFFRLLEMYSLVVCVCATVDIRCLHIVSEIIVVIRNNQHQVIIIIIINTVPKKHKTKRRNKLHVLLPSKCLRFHDIQNRMEDQQQRNENEEVNNGF